MSYEMNELLELTVEQNASDLHLQVGQPPTLRVSGSMMPIDGPPLTPADTEALMKSITPEVYQTNFKANGGESAKGVTNSTCSTNCRNISDALLPCHWVI